MTQDANKPVHQDTHDLSFSLQKPTKKGGGPEGS